MTFRTPGLRGGGIATSRSRLLLPVAVILAVAVVLFLVFTAIWTDLLWYRSVGFSSVYSTELWVRVVLFIGAGVLMGLVVGANMAVAYRLRPAYRPLSVEQQGLERYRAAVDPHRRLIATALIGVLALLTGSSASGRWHTWLAFMNRTSFGRKDPQFHKDISFFVFTYPFLRLVLGYLFATVILSIMVAVIVHYLYGGLRLQGPGDKASPPARAHLSVLVGVFVLLKAVAYWYDRYGLALSERGVVSGPSYTDVNAVLPAKTILAVIALICAVMFFMNSVRRGMTLPGVGFGLLVLSAILVGGVYPLLIQQFQVRPNELDKESKYIGRNITATREAYGVDKAKVTAYGAETKLSQDQLRSEASTISGVRLLDPAVVGSTFQQLQQVRNFYRFPDVLDIDRYQLEGTSRDTVVAVREVEGAPEGRKGWVNDHLVYTHGYGFVGALGNKVTDKGEPDYVEKNIPPTGALGTFEPRIYFGERSPSYSVVGAPAGTQARELDYPDESAAGQQNNTYKGSGGVPIGSLVNRLLFSAKFQEKNLLLSGAINKDARILYNRTPRERVERVAPWLTLDGDPYPAVVGGRVLWILDGYTTSAGYPYSERMSLGDATRDTVTDTRSAVARQANDRVNYMRNSVKATVDAYDGTVRLYAWDEKDPVLRTWMKAFDGVVQPKSEITPQLMAHLRYPEDLFKVQRRILARYHVQQPGAFYSGQDFWDVPQDPTTSKGKTQPPYYLSLRMPGEPEPKFSLTTAYSPRGRPNLAAFMSVDATSGQSYGQMRVLELPRNSPIQGPGQVQNSFESDASVKKVLTDLRIGGTQTVLGNLLTLPFGGGLLYVEPVYAQASGGTEQEPYPILKQVLVMYGTDVGAGATLQEALNQIFKDTGSAAPPPSTGGTAGGQASADVQRAISDAQKAFNDGQEALKKNDWTSYGEAQRRLKEALDRLAKAQSATSQQKPSSSPSPAASPSTSPSAAPSATPSG
ncbi:MAG TPA: UPF0182 family protein [Actinomadura sp.]|nr:UPF0182 family protein [Actinomadura sp.]